MMLLSRFWYAILAVALAAAVALVYIGINQHNRIRVSDTRTIVEHDRDIVDWYLQVDARRRLDALTLVSVDSKIQTNLTKATAADGKVPQDVREATKKVLEELAPKYASAIHDEGKGGVNPNMLFAVDARGRVAGHVNFDRAAMLKDDSNFELGGYPVVADALHGWQRDDTWVVDREAIYRVVAQPVVAAEGAAPIGAIVGMRRVDEGYAHRVVEYTYAPVVFFVNPPDGDGPKVIARDKPEKVDLNLDELKLDAKMLASDEHFQKEGVTSLKTAGNLAYEISRMVGAGWEMGAGYAVARKTIPITDPNALLQQADEGDKKAVPVPFVAGLLAGALLMGLLATIFEHSMPLGKLKREADKLAKGEQDAFPLAKLSGAYRRIAKDVNEGMERVIAKGGGASRKAADLEQILGPVPAAPQMSAFSFNFDAPAPSSSNEPKPADDMFPDLPPAGQVAPAALPTLGSAPATPAGPPPKPAHAAPPGPPPKPATPHAPPGPPPPKTAAEKAKADEEAIARAAAMLEDDDEATQVAKIPEELMKASATGEQKAIENADELVQWRQTFDDFVSMRKKCNEPTTGLSFEKFQVQLRKNKEQLVKQYACRRVKFTVYEKEGKAALKATPIKD
jgi:hypothetical protein